jgi:C1A family cysteine protease
MRFKLGCLKDKKDNRDYLMRAYLPVIKLPAKIDYTKKMSPVRDQGDEGTCVGFATTAGMKEYQEKIDYEKLIELSPRFLYSECKKIDGMPDEEGTSIRIAVKVLQKKGVCREKYWKYKPHQKDKPKKGAYDDAIRFRVKTYARILDLNELRMTLATKGPCVIGVYVFSSMLETKDGKIKMPGRREKTLGGHAICPVGYDDKKGFIKFKNSWSTSWGDKGYGYLPYEYIEKYMMDAWSTVDIDDPNPLTIEKITRFI